MRARLRVVLISTYLTDQPVKVSIMDDKKMNSFASIVISTRHYIELLFKINIKVDFLGKII